MIIYTATDSAGNHSETSRTVEVVAASSAPASGGGLMNYLLLSLVLVGIRRRFVRFKSIVKY